MNKKVQILRAIAIFAVVMIHTCPSGLKSVAIRPLINFGVGMFIFLSGYLTKLEVENISGFYRKRIVRILLPYLIWTTVYTIVLYGMDDLIPNILTTKACYAFYYVGVYIQFVLLTPVIGKLIRSKYRWIGWAVQPIFIILLIYIPEFMNKPLEHPWNGIFFVVWFSMYYLGMALGNKVIKIDLNKKVIFVLLVASICLQWGEGIAWYKFDHVSMAASQIKFSAMLTTIMFIICAYRFIESEKYEAKDNILYNVVVRIGDYSFGIFLVHSLLISIAYKTSFWKLIPFPISSVLIFFVSLCCVVIGTKVLGKKISKYLGLN